MGQSLQCFQHASYPLRRSSSDDISQSLNVEDTSQNRSNSTASSSNILSCSEHISRPDEVANKLDSYDAFNNNLTTEAALLQASSMSFGHYHISHDMSAYTTVNERPNEVSCIRSIYMEAQEMYQVKELECVICLDTFDESNPRIRTLCECGVNRTNFHLSCLYEWLARSRECPVCREYLYYEENE